MVASFADSQVSAERVVIAVWPVLIGRGRRPKSSFHSYLRTAEPVRVRRELGHGSAIELPKLRTPGRGQLVIAAAVQDGQVDDQSRPHAGHFFRMRRAPSKDLPLIPEQSDISDYCKLRRVP